MLKNILNVSKVSVISKKHQSSIQGGHGTNNNNCRELPWYCEVSGGVIRDCLCIYS